MAFPSPRGGRPVTLEEAVDHAILTGRLRSTTSNRFIRELIDDAIRQWLTDQGGDFLQPTDDGWRAVKAEEAAWTRPVGDHRRLVTLTTIEEPT
jgi:hypothetical protein